MIEQAFDIGDSIIHRLDPRSKIIAACAFSAAVALADGFAAAALGFVFGPLFIFLARLPFKTVFFRILMVNGLILLLWLFLPFAYKGNSLFSIGPLVATREGVRYAGLICLKANAIITTLIALVATIPIFEVGKAMRRLYVPSKIVHLFLFTYRYIHVIYMEYQRIMRAVRIRGFRPRTNLHTYRTYAYLFGLLFLRSYERAQRVHAAMLCRGFNERFYDLSEFTFKRSDYSFMVGMLLGVVGILSLQWCI
jgi:cobalt/nickel transport system permease protein